MAAWPLIVAVVFHTALAEVPQTHNLVHLKSAVPPPKNLEVVNHDKEAGSGYNPGSPLYARQQALKKGGKDAFAAPVSSWNIDGPGWLVILFALIIGIACLVGVAYLNRPYLYLQEKTAHYKMPEPALPPPSHGAPHYATYAPASTHGVPPQTIQTLQPEPYYDRQAKVLGTSMGIPQSMGQGTRIDRAFSPGGPIADQGLSRGFSPGGPQDDRLGGSGARVDRAFSPGGPAEGLSRGFSPGGYQDDRLGGSSQYAQRLHSSSSAMQIRQM